MKILCCVFNWNNQYNNAIKIQDYLSEFLDVIVINSDDNNTKEGWINIGNESYFSAQFKTALDIFDDSKYDALWHIQADAFFKNWEYILDSAISTFEKYNWGVYAPNVNDTYYIPERTDVFSLTENLKVVATTDCICWFIHKDYINLMKENYFLMENNVLGWGWDLIICALCHNDGRYVLRGYYFEVKHPASTGYKKDQAEQEMYEMFQKMSTKIKRDYI